MNRTVIFFAIEPGYLEYQAIILGKSLRNLAMVDEKYTLIAVNPLANKRLKTNTYKQLEILRVEVIEVNLNKHFRFYPVANKIFISAYIEEHYANSFENFIFLDSDTLVLKSFDDLLDQDFKIAVKPDDLNRIGILKDEEPNNFWKLVHDSCNVRTEDHWLVNSSINNHLIRAYFNSGVIVKKGQDSFFNNWSRNFLKAITHKRSFRIDYFHYYFFDQATLGSTIVANYNSTDVKILSNSYNYPLQYHEVIKSEKPEEAKNLKIIHYRDVNFLYECAKNGYLFDSNALNEWILNNVNRKKINKTSHSWLVKVINYQIHKAKYKYELMKSPSLLS